MQTIPIIRAVVLTLAVSFVLGGCLFVRETEHTITLNENGGGDAWVRLVDIRSDSQTDSVVTADLEDMLSSFHEDVDKEFERQGRTLVAKRFILCGDTLNAELHYRFQDLAAVEGLTATADELWITVSEDREIVRTNGTVAPWYDNGQRISWPRGAGSLVYRVRERAVPDGTQLGPAYRLRAEK